VTHPPAFNNNRVFGAKSVISAPERTYLIPRRSNRDGDRWFCEALPWSPGEAQVSKDLMINASTRQPGRQAAAAAGILLGLLVAAAGCNSSAPVAAPEPQAKQVDLPAPSATLPDVEVALKPSSHSGPELTGSAWYLTSVKDPARGSYTAAVERRSLTRVWFDVADESAQRASIVLPLKDGRPTDLILSVEHGRFDCGGQGREKGCVLRVSIDAAAPRPVRFCATRQHAGTSLHLVGGDDARKLLAALGKGKRLRVQPSFVEEGSPEIEFALSGLNPTIARLVKRSVAAVPKVAANTPGS
jgi:hypothetical protein